MAGGGALTTTIQILPITDGEGDRREAVVEGLAGRCPSTMLRMVPLPKHSLGRI